LRRVFLLFGTQAAFGAAPARPPITSVSHLQSMPATPPRLKRFYVHDLGAVEAGGSGKSQGYVIILRPVQFVEVLPLLPAGIEPDGTISLSTPAMRRGCVDIWRRKKIAVPKASTKARCQPMVPGQGSEGVTVEFVSRAGFHSAMCCFPISFTSAPSSRSALEDTFYRDVLGFRPYWFGGMKDDAPPSLGVAAGAGRHDWLEYMVTTNTLTQAQMGVLNHIALGVPNMEAAIPSCGMTTALQGQIDARGQQIIPKIGARRQVAAQPAGSRTVPAPK